MAEWDAKGWDALPLAPKELSRLFPALRQTAKAAERWTAKNPPEAIRDIIRVWGVLNSYRPIGQTRWSRALVRYGAMRGWRSRGCWVCRRGHWSEGQRRLGAILATRLGRSYKLALEPDGSPLFPLIPLVACWRYEPREHPRPLALARPAIPPSPLSDRVGYSDHVRFRGYLPVHWCSGLQPPCLRFAVAVTGRHARLGTRLLARLCRGRHLRRLSSTRLQGATLIEPDMQISRIRLSDKTVTPSPTARCAHARSGVRARSARKGARVDRSRPCAA